VTRLVNRFKRTETHRVGSYRAAQKKLLAAILLVQKGRENPEASHHLIVNAGGGSEGR